MIFVKKETAFINEVVKASAIKLEDMKLIDAEAAARMEVELKSREVLTDPMQSTLFFHSGPFILQCEKTFPTGDKLALFKYALRVGEKIKAELIAMGMSVPVVLPQFSL